MPWYFYAILSALLVSLSALLEKRTLNKEHATEFAATLAIFSAVIAFPLLFVDGFFGVTWKAVGFIYVVSILVSFAFLLIAKAVRHMEISAVAPLLVVSPGVTALFALIFLGEELSGSQWLGMIFLLAGAYVLQVQSGFSLLHPFKNLKGSKYVVFLLLALVLYGLSSVTDRVILFHLGVPPLTYIGVLHLFMAFNMTLILWFYHGSLVEIPKGIKNFGPIIFLIAILLVAHRWAEAEAISVVYVALALAIKRSSALFTTIIGGELFHEKHLLRKIIAVFILLFGVVSILG